MRSIHASTPRLTRNASHIANTFVSLLSLTRCSIPNTLPLPRAELTQHLLERVEDRYLTLGVVQLEPFDPRLDLVHAPDDSGRHFLRLGPISRPAKHGF